MRKLQISDIASLAFAASGIGEKNTVSSGPDDGANNCQASHWWQVMRHNTTAKAIANILNARIAKFDPPAPEFEVAGLTSTGAANIVGHGNEGLLETGMGQSGPYDVNKLVFPWNEHAWGPEFDRLRPSPVTYVSIWACHPGAGPDGAEFVYRLAVRCQRAVRAGTGFLYCNNKQIWWEKGSQWQVGTPGNKPNPIPAPSPHAFMGEWQFDRGAGKAVGPKAVKSVVVERRILSAATSEKVTAEGADAAEFVARFFQSPPIDMEGVTVPAMVTATVSLTFEDGATAQFTVYNDRLAIDRESGTGYYTMSLGLLGV